MSNATFIRTTKYFTQKLFRKFYSLNMKLVLIIAVFTFYSAYDLSVLDNVNCSAFECALVNMSDHYYIVFFFIILYFTTVIDPINDQNALIIMRTGKYHLFYASKLSATALFTLSVVAMHAILAVIISAFKHDLANQFSGTLEGKVAFSNLILVFEAHFQTPLMALLAVCLYLVLGLCLCSGFLMLISHYFSEKATIFMSAITYLIMVMTLHLNIDRFFPYLFVNNYLFLHRVLEYDILHVLMGISVSLLIAMPILASRSRVKHLLKKIQISLAFGGLLSSKALIALTTVSLLVALISAVNFRVYGMEGIVMLFWGYGLGYLQIIEFIQLLLMNGTVTYILSAYLASKTSTRDLVMIRSRHKWRWFSKLQLSTLKLACFELLSLCLFSLLIGLFLRNSPDGSPILTNSLVTAVVGILLRLFEIMFVQMLFLVIASRLGNITMLFLITILMYLCLTLLNFKWIPFGLSSLSRLVEMTNYGFLINAAIAAIILGTLYVIMYLYMVIKGTKRLLNCERNT